MADRAPLVIVSGEAGELTAGDILLAAGLKDDTLTFSTPLSGPVQRLQIDANGNIVPGTAALATGATNGFFYIETCAGVPTGVPASLPSGRVPIVYDTVGKQLYFYTAGAWFSLTQNPAGAAYGEMTVTDNAVVMAVNTQDIMHAVVVHSLTQVDAASWSFTAGVIRTISSSANYSGTVPGTVLFTTSAAHGLATGNWVTITGTTNYNGTRQITVVSTTTFYATVAFVSNQAGQVQRGDYLVAVKASKSMAAITGTYLPAANNQNWRFAMMKNGAELPNVVLGTRASNAVPSAFSMQGIVDVVAGDVLWFALRNETSTVDITIRHSNVTVIQV